jgi:hypothetical protein
MSRFRIQGGCNLVEEVPLGREEQKYAAEARAAMEHPAYKDDKHPDHRKVLEGVEDLHFAAYGTAEEVAARLKKKSGGGI